MSIAAMSWDEWIDSRQWRGARDVALPMLPAFIHDVLPLLLETDLSVVRVAHVIAKEQVLATRVLRLANSAYCAPLQEVTTLNDAIVRMGTAAVRNVAFAACFAARLQAGDAYGPQSRALGDHAIGTAYLARLVAERAGTDPEEAFVHGLLHDIGKLLLLKLQRDFVEAGGRLPSPSDLAWCVRDRHAALGAEVLRLWNLPLGIQQPVEFHHEPAGADPDFRRDAAVVYVANRLSHRYGFGCEWDSTIDPTADPLAATLDLTPDWLADIDRRAPGLFAVARQSLY